MTRDLNPFLEYEDVDKGTKLRENEDLHEKLRKWTLDNLEGLSLSMMTSKINEILSIPIQNDVAFL